MNVESIIMTNNELPQGSRTIIHLALVYNKINDALTAALKPFEVSIQQFNVLRILRGQNGNPANLSTINQRMITKTSNTTRLVDKLIAKNLVKRNVCKSNRRKVEIFITQLGLDQLVMMDNVVRKTESTIVGEFNSNELKHLNELLDKF